MNKQIPFVTVTLTGSRGHAPQDSGAKMLVGKDGLLEGTVGGGKIEAKAIQFAVQLISAAGGAQLVTWNLQTDVGMSCGGEVSLFFESHFTRPWPVAIFGAGHVAQALTRLMITLDCQVTCIDAREEWINKLPDSPRLKKIIHPHPAEFAAQLGERDFVVVMTQGHTTDFPILKTIMSGREAAYIGVLGSPVKAAKMRKELTEAGVPAGRIEKLHCPMGLAIGNNDPAEIAISIAAQLLQFRTPL